MTDTILYTLLGGILPALVWLLFWLREDYKHPEPRALLLKAFLFGMLAVLLVIPFQKLTQSLVLNSTALALLIWTAFEELFKLGAAYFGGMRSVEDNEPLDPLIYMITAALGFAALENAMFLVEPLLNESVLSQSFFLTGNLRFIGASLLHVVASGIVGASLAFTFYKSFSIRLVAVVSATLIAIIFHTLFNLMIIELGGMGMLYALLSVWVGVILLLLTFERVKTIAPK